MRLEPEVMAALRRVAKAEGLKIAAAAARAITMAMQQAMQEKMAAETHRAMRSVLTDLAKEKRKK